MTSIHLRIRPFGALALLALLAVPARSGRAAAPQFRSYPLAQPAGGATTTGVALTNAGVGDSLSICVGGSAACSLAVSGFQRGATWFRPAGSFSSPDPTPLDTVGSCSSGGRSGFIAVALTNAGVGDSLGLMGFQLSSSTSTQLVAAGWYQASGQDRRPAWYVESVDANGAVVGRYRQDVLVNRGEARAVVSDSFPSSHEHDIFAVGWFGLAPGMQKAGYFECQSDLSPPCSPDLVPVIQLPDYCASCPSSAEGMAGRMRAMLPGSGRHDTLVVVGWADTAGLSRPVFWDFGDRGCSSHCTVPFPAGMIQGAALDVTAPDSNSTLRLLVAGWTAGPAGDTTAALWRTANGTVKWSAGVLHPVSGRVRSLANAVATGTDSFVVGASWSSSSDRAATLWRVHAHDTTTFNLNTITDSLAAGVVLREATGIVRRGSGFAISGWATLPHGGGDNDTLAFLLASTTLGTTDVPQAPRAAIDFRALPNPTHSRVTLEYTLSREARVRLTVHDISGRWIGTLVEGAEPPGDHRLVWDGHDADGRAMPPGLYVVRLAHDGGVQARTVAVLR